MVYVDNQVNTREIFTKAVCAKGRKYSQALHIVKPVNVPTSILGAWVINHTCISEKVGDIVEVAGSYDLNIWYSYDNNTKTTVAKELVTYVEEIPLQKIDTNYTGNQMEVITLVKQQPNCLEAKIDLDGASIRIKVEKEFFVELVGETKISVLVLEPEDKEIDEQEAYDEEYDQDETEILIDDEE
ncbi:hypothetical protein BHU72_08120 [Desulfuribacillus stibiiarsenatis]|uniref:Spore coat protein n=1 Tax=Desulfuribacillus stibiiarsenatis TaxID=1390249 RepID=A0A1E5L3R2_9FIRM|nr:outer spore coat protein CotE [Desulfuribacillus stibiiarsenatis]OEH84790.1 hypothetical protein BHU72_08120 [Desulfuribacillus stibiiarsenatis]